MFEMMRAMLYSSLAFGMLGCVGMGPLESPMLDDGEPPPEATLCLLVPGVSDAYDAKAILGAPATESQGSDGAQSLLYLYSGGRTLYLSFGPDGRFRQSFTGSIRFPVCWMAARMPEPVGVGPSGSVSGVGAGR
jgi:hypothetical protein